MKERLNIFLSDILVTRCFKLTGLLILSQFVVLVLLFGKLPQHVPLFYSLPWGEAQLAPAVYLVIFPGISLITLITNIGLSLAVPLKEVFLWRLLAVGSLFASALACLGLIKIIFLVA